MDSNLADLKELMTAVLTADHSADSMASRLAAQMDYHSADSTVPPTVDHLDYR